MDDEQTLDELFPYEVTPPPPPPEAPPPFAEDDTLTPLQKSRQKGQKGLR